LSGIALVVCGVLGGQSYGVRILLEVLYVQGVMILAVMGRYNV